MELAAVCDISEQRLDAVKKKYPEIPVFNNAEDMYKKRLVQCGYYCRSAL